MTTDVRFEDGSAVRRAGEVLVADAGIAAAVLEQARRVVALPAEEAARSFPSEDTRFRAVLALAYEEALRGEPFWLFRAQPIACVPSGGDARFAEALEPRVAALDEAVRTGSLGDPAESARRRVVYAELHAAALIDPPLLLCKADALSTLGFPHLAALTRAAAALEDYRKSPERAKELGRAAGEVALALDWARDVIDAPPPFRRFEWWAACERALVHPRPPDAPRGRLFLAQGGTSAELFFRSEDGTRRVLHAVRSRAHRGGVKR